MQEIMLVEDEALVLLDLSLTVEQLGYRIHSECISVDDGMSALALSTPDAALLDINVGGSLVWPLARELTARGCPIIFISANCNHDELRTEFRCAAAIEKPSSPVDIDRALTAALGGAGYCETEGAATAGAGNDRQRV